LPGRRSRDPRDARAIHERRARTARSRQAMDRRHQGRVPKRAAAARRGAAGQARALRLQDAVTGRRLAIGSPDMRMVPFTFAAIEELALGPKWAAVFEERWPHYPEWFLREGA